MAGSKARVSRVNATMLTCIICVDSLRIGGRKRAEIAESGVVDEQIDRRLLCRCPRNQCIDRLGLRQIRRADFYLQSRMAPEQLHAQFLQPRLPSRHQHEFRGASGKLPRKLAPDAGRGAGHKRMTTFESHRAQFFVRSGSSTRQTFSARIL